jgi:putative transposase
MMIQAVEKQFGSKRKAPKTIKWLTNNGSCYTAAETRSFTKELGLKPLKKTVTDPQSNGMIECFVKKMMRDYAELVKKPDSKNLIAKIKDWLDGYNSKLPHRALGYLPPSLFREKRTVT